jgi:S-DNA-T family DNA segregation ATPase FtsK/SpoIIIE
VVIGAPITVDARLGIGVTGPTVLAASVARAVIVQLARSLSPRTHWRAGAPPTEPWLEVLPHPTSIPRVVGSFAEFGPIGGHDPLIVVAVAESPARLPAACRVVLGVGESRLRIVGHPDLDQLAVLEARPVSRAEAAQFAARLAADAAREGIASVHAQLPDTVELAPLLRPVGSGDHLSLACEPAVGAGEPFTLDLVRHGPHAVVGGTTGSGKSELLIAWVIAMAASRPPQQVTFLLIDFKGGAAFSGLARLPHTVGIITDLDARTAQRGLESLRAEVRHRERVLLEHGARSIDDVQELPRLVIMVDEFAAMLAETPELHSLFSDLASRGRSLGIHLVLCTQRPTGVVRDGVLANADLRISLRVNNRADSQAVVACDDAADIALAARGRAVVRLAGEPQRSVQFALTGRRDVELVARRWAQCPPPRRPWCEPLPAFVRAADLGTGDGAPVFGLLDLPSEQRQEAVSLFARDLAEQRTMPGAVIVLGASRSGRTTALRALVGGRRNLLVASPSPDAAWDVIEALTSALDAGGDLPALVVLDDLDALVPRFTGEYRQGIVDALCRVLREGPSRGATVLMSAQRVTGELQPIAALVPDRLLLRHSSRQDFVVAGGDGGRFEPDLPPGRALWHGNWMQLVCDAPPLPAPASPRVSVLDPGRPAAVVTHRAAAFLTRWPASVRLADAGPDLVALAGSGATLVGDVDEWQSRWGAIAALRGHAQLIFDGCTPADLRALTRSRQLPPPLTEGHCWRVDDEGRAERVRLVWPA